MKKLMFFMLLISGMALIRCQKEDIKLDKDVTNVNQTIISEQNTKLDVFAQMIAVAAKNENFRSLIKEKVLEQFDFDYDVLWADLATQKITENGKEILVKEFANTILSGTKSAYKSVDDLLKNIPNPQISIPVNIDKWDDKSYVPLVAYAYFDEQNKKSLFAYDSNSDKTQLSVTEEPTEPVIVVGLSERVDKNGNLMVGVDGFVIPEDVRISAKEVQNVIKSSNLKSCKNWEPKIEIVKTLDPVSELPSDYIENTQPKIRVEASPLKSANAVPSAPINVGAGYLPTPLTIQVAWEAVTGATSYKIYRNMVYIGSCSSNVYLDNSVTEGNLYYYRVVAVNSSGDSPYSSQFSIRASKRADAGDEYIRKIQITETKFRQIESWDDGRLELQVKVIWGYNIDANTASFLDNTYTRGDHNNSNGIDKSQIVNTWYFWDCSIGTWRQDVMSSVINLEWTELDQSSMELTGLKKTVGVETTMTANGSWSGGSKFSIGGSASGKYAVNKEYTYSKMSNDVIFASQIVLFGDPIDVPYLLDGFSWRMVHVVQNNKCPYIGSWDGANCHVGTAPANTTAFIHNNRFYYTGAPVCSSSGSYYENGYCRFSTASNSVWLYNGSYFYNAINGNQCPVQGSWFDGAHCRFPSIPSNSNPTVYNTYTLKYTPVIGCPLAGSGWDGANCFVANIPSQVDPFIHNNRWYVRKGY